MEKSRGFVKIYGIGLLWSAGFAFSFLAFFYLAMAYSVDGYALEPYYPLVNLLVLSFLTFTAAAAPGPARLYLLACYLALWVSTAVTVSYILLYKSALNFNTLHFIWESNTAEAAEFFQECLRRQPSLPLWIAACTLAPLPPAWKAAKTIRAAKREVSAARRWGLFAAASALSALLVVCSGVMDFNYAFHFYHSYLSYQSERRLVAAIGDYSGERIKLEDIRASAPADVRETYIVVIGESASRHHWKIYGYPRPTTPFMEKRLPENGIFCFNNVNATAISTLDSLLRDLSLIDQTTTQWGDYSYSIIDLFNGAGFKTYWLSNNAVLGVFDTLLQLLSRNAGYRRFTEPRDADLRSMQRGMVADGAVDFKRRNPLLYDEVLLPWLEEALDGEGNKKAIFLHLKGSHSIYQYRYPEPFDCFGSAEGVRNPSVASDPSKVEIVNHYDNSIRYTDFIIDSIIRRVEARKGLAWVLYFSDHGEDVYDHDLGAYGRNPENINKYMLDVPFVAWFSEEYRRARDTGSFGAFLDRPYRLDDAVYSIIDLAGLKTRFADPSRSVFSPSYQMRPRACGGQLYLDIPPAALANPKTRERERELGVRFLQGIGEL